jgi:virulence factor Mce-like protein
MIRSARHRRARVASRHRLIGVLTIVAIAIVGWIAYRANFGLPWQSRYAVYADVPNADRLIEGADVRAGGVLVGEVVGVTAEPGADGAAAYARVKLALDSSAAPLPIDSTIQVRPASVLGLTYVDLDLGASRRTIAAGGTLPLRAARPSSDLTDLLGIFDRDSAVSFRRALTGLAYGVAGRGTALNATIASFDELLPDVTTVAAELAAPQTMLGATLNSYERLIAEVAPVAQQLAGAFGGAAVTFGALASERSALGAAIDAAPGAERATTIAFERVDPALDGLARLTVALRPAGALLAGSVDGLDRALIAGAPALRLVPSFAGRLHAALASVGGLARDYASKRSLVKLGELVGATNGVLSALVPAQVYCNVLGTWGQYFGSMWGGLGVGQGPSLANLMITSGGASGEVFQNARPSSNVGIDPLPYEDAQQCQSGNEPWTGHQQLNNPPGILSRTTRTTVPPPGVTELARDAGLLAPIRGIR